MLVKLTLLLFMSFWLGEGLTQDEYREFLMNSGATRLAIEVMLKVDRKYYVRPALPKTNSPSYTSYFSSSSSSVNSSFSPYSIEPQPIFPGGINISSPSVHLHALSQVIKHTSNRQSVKNVLDVGSGSGYMMPCLALIFENAQVWGIEEQADLVTIQKDNLSKDPVAKGLSHRLHSLTGNALEKGVLPKDVTFDVVHFGASYGGNPMEGIEGVKEETLLVYPRIESDGQQLMVSCRVVKGKLVELDDPLPVIYIPMTPPASKKSP